MASDINPSLTPTNNLANFRFWCQKVLPLVYDDSLSYYEVIGKMVVQLNDVIDNVNADTENVLTLKDAFLELQDYVNNFFDDIDQLASYAERAETAKTAANQSAINASESAANASASSLAAMNARDAANSARQAAETSANTASTAADHANIKANEAAQSAITAQTAQASASQSATLAATDRSAAQTAASTATTKANEANASATNAAESATNAEQSKDDAEALVNNVQESLDNIQQNTEDISDLKESFNNYDNLKKNIISPNLFQNTVKKPLGEKYWENFDFTAIEGRAVTTIDRNNKEHTFYRPVSCKVTKNDTATSDIRMSVPTGSEISLVGISAIRLSIYLEDASLFSQIGLEIIGTSWTRAFPISNKKNGWNVFTVYTFDANITTWGTTRILRLYTQGSAGRTFYFDTLQFLRRPKGLIIFVNDSAYKTFYTNGYPTLKQMNVPVTWALDPVLIGSEATRITKEDLDTLALDGNSEFSFHGYTGNPTSAMTGAELRDDCVSALRYLQKNGLLPKHFWRAAFVQNNAPNYMDVVDIVPVLASYNSSNSPDTFPFRNPYNIPRVPLHSQTAGAPAVFERLRKTHCLYVIYTHGIASTGTYNITPENWDSFVSALQTAINDGYVECTTYDRLMTSEDY